MKERCIGKLIENDFGCAVSENKEIVSCIGALIFLQLADCIIAFR